MVFLEAFEPLVFEDLAFLVVGDDTAGTVLAVRSAGALLPVVVDALEEAAFPLKAVEAVEDDWALAAPLKDDALPLVAETPTTDVSTAGTVFPATDELLADAELPRTVAEVEELELDPLREELELLELAVPDTGAPTMLGSTGMTALDPTTEEELELLLDAELAVKELEAVPPVPANGATATLGSTGTGTVPALLNELALFEVALPDTDGVAPATLGSTGTAPALPEVLELAELVELDELELPDKGGVVPATGAVAALPDELEAAPLVEDDDADPIAEKAAHPGRCGP